MKESNRRTWAWIAVGAIALLWTIWILAFQPKSATYHVRRVMNAYVNSDSRTLAHYQIDEEANLMFLTAKQIHQMNEKIVFPVLQEYADGKSVTIDGQNKMKLGTIRLRNKQGRTAEFGMNVYSHKNDHKIFVTQAVLGVWIARYSLEKNVPITTENMFRAVLEGAEQDQAVLEQVGLKGLVSPDPSGGTIELRTFEQIKQRQRERLKLAAR